MGVCYYCVRFLYSAIACDPWTRSVRRAIPHRPQYCEWERLRLHLSLYISRIDHGLHSPALRFFAGPFSCQRSWRNWNTDIQPAVSSGSLLYRVQVLSVVFAALNRIAGVCSTQPLYSVLGVVLCTRTQRTQYSAFSCDSLCSSGSLERSNNKAMVRSWPADRAAIAGAS